MEDKKLESIKDLMEVVSSTDVGLVIFDKNYTIRVWNLFMVTHSGLNAEGVMGKNLFTLFSDIPQSWFSEKIKECIEQGQKRLTTWEERPYLFKFSNVRERSKAATYMYQNITFIPLASANGEFKNFAITINDVTDIAASTQKLDAVVNEYSKNTHCN